MVDIKVNITALTHGKPSDHCVNMRAEISAGDSPQRVLEASVPRYVDHKERSLPECCEAAVADILRQLVT